MSSVDVIVPCYQYGHFLYQCVESVLEQEGIDVRVLIIDDASPDNTAEVAAQLAKDDARVTFLRHATNAGHIATYNEGIDWACAEYMLILSADDYLLPNALHRTVILMDAHPNVGFTFGRAIELHEGLDTKKTEIQVSTPEDDFCILSGTEFIELSGSRNIVRTPTAVVRTSLQKRLGGYLPELPHTGDMEMWLRFAAHASVGKVGACQAVYRRHSGNMSLNYLRNLERYLLDLHQRRAAFDWFFQTCGRRLANVQQLHHKVFWALGCETIGHASTAFNAGEMDVSVKLSEFALSVCPQVRGSLQWKKLVFKRSMGLKSWQALQPILLRLRKCGFY